MKVEQCNLCNNEDFELVYRRKKIEIITKKDNFKIDTNNMVCKNCGLVFQNPHMDKDKLKRFYEDQYRQSVTDISGGAVREDQKKYLDRFLNDKKGEVLDIGSFEGYFLSLFQKEGWDTIGIEPSKEAAKVCREKYGIKVYKQFFENVDFEDEKFDLITIRHVLEHVDDPLNIIKLMRRYLKDDGIVFVEVPHMKKFDYNNIADFFDFQHIYNFTVNVMKSYLYKLGFEVINLTEDLEYPGFRVVARKGEEKSIICDYENAKELVLNYRRNRQNNLQKMKQFLNQKNKLWKKQNQDIIIYGAGFHTAQLFDYVIDKESFNIIGIVDKSLEKEGKRFFEFKVYHNSKISELKPDVIIISSYAFQDEIYEFLKPFEEEDIEIVKLYEETNSYDTLK